MFIKAKKFQSAVTLFELSLKVPKPVIPLVIHIYIMSFPKKITSEYEYESNGGYFQSDDSFYIGH